MRVWQYVIFLCVIPRLLFRWNIWNWKWNVADDVRKYHLMGFIISKQMFGDISCPWDQYRRISLGHKLSAVMLKTIPTIREATFIDDHDQWITVRQIGPPAKAAVKLVDISHKLAWLKQNLVCLI